MGGTYKQHNVNIRYCKIHFSWQQEKTISNQNTYCILKPKALSHLINTQHFNPKKEKTKLLVYSQQPAVLHKTLCNILEHKSKVI